MEELQKTKVFETVRDNLILKQKTDIPTRITNKRDKESDAIWKHLFEKEDSEMALNTFTRTINPTQQLLENYLIEPLANVKVEEEPYL